MFTNNDSIGKTLRAGIIDLDDPGTFHCTSKIIASVSAERRYAFGEISLFDLSVMLPFSEYRIGMNVKSFSSGDYRESQVGLSLGRSLGKINLTLLFNYHRISIAGYGSDRSVTGGVSVGGMLTDKIYASFTMLNPIGGKLKFNVTEKIASVYRANLMYVLSPSLAIQGTVLKVEKVPATIRILLLYAFATKLDAMIGINAASGSPLAGCSYRLRDFRIGIAASYQYPIGLTPALTLNYMIKNWKLLRSQRLK